LWLASSELAIERKQYSKALGDIQSAEKVAADLPLPQHVAHARLARLLSGAAQIGAGRIDAAREQLAAERHLGELAEKAEKWWHEALAGEVALASGDLQPAATAFAAGEPSVRMWFEMIRGTESLLANTLTLRDGPARVAKARGDLRGAVQNKSTRGFWSCGRAPMSTCPSWPKHEVSD
jgi:hypothetical protein